MFNNQSINY